MDGARIANACASLGCTLKEMTVQCGVDVLSFGGTKNGLMFGEALVFFDKNLTENFLRLRKQNLQLHSKMRYIAAQYLAILEDDLWLKNAEKSNNIPSTISSTKRRDVNSIRIFCILIFNNLDFAKSCKKALLPQTYLQSSQDSKK